MARISARDLIEAGVHFGHQAGRWDPKMAKYIFGKRNRMHIIDVRQTVRGLIEATHFLRQLAAAGGRILFVGTKRQAKEAVRREAERTGMFHANERWLGGTLTNLGTVLRQTRRLDDIEQKERDGALARMNKKMVASFMREKRKLLRNLLGIRRMKSLPSVLVVVDPRREKIAVTEAHKLKIPVIAIIDTDSDPDPIDIPIPANDDAIRSVDLILSYLGEAVLEGRRPGGLSSRAAAS